jgi:hypothetical protein
MAAEKDDTPSHRRALSGTALYVATSALVAWLGLACFLLVRSNVAEIQWSRQAWIFSSVEAVAFTAAGALFGTAVQRHHVDRAEDRAEQAEKSALENGLAAERGRALAAALLADVEDHEPSEDGGLTDMSTEGAGYSGPRVARRHARLARLLFEQDSHR